MRVRPEEFSRTCLPFEGFDLASGFSRIPEPFRRQLANREERLADWRSLLAELCSSVEADTVRLYVDQEFQAGIYIDDVNYAFSSGMGGNIDKGNRGGGGGTWYNDGGRFIQNGGKGQKCIFF